MFGAEFLHCKRFSLKAIQPADAPINLIGINMGAAYAGMGCFLAGIGYVIQQFK